MHRQYSVYGSPNFPQTLSLDQASAANRLLEKRRQMFEVQETMIIQKEESNRREDAFKVREEGLRMKDHQLQGSLIKFNKFLMENELKKNRALKRAVEERKSGEAKEMEIKRFEIHLKLKLEEERILKEKLLRNLKYQDYLESVVQNMSKFFLEVPDILNRYKTLREANIYLLEKQHMDEGSNENTLREFQIFKKSKENQVLNGNNAIADLQVKMEHKQAETNAMQEVIDNSITEASDKALLLGQVLSSVSNILDRCEETFRRRHKKPQMDRPTYKSRGEGMSITEQCCRTASKLDEISMFLADFKDIREEYIREHGIHSLSKLKKSSAMHSSDRDLNSKPSSEHSTARSSHSSTKT